MIEIRETRIFAENSFNFSLFACLLAHAHEFQVSCCHTAIGINKLIFVSFPQSKELLFSGDTHMHVI